MALNRKRPASPEGEDLKKYRGAEEWSGVADAAAPFSN